MSESDGESENDGNSEADSGHGGPLRSSLAEGFASELESKPADERVYRVALGLSEPTRVAAVAKQADCAPDTARRHLKRLADIGVVERVSTDPDAFARNESYFEWRKRERLSSLSEDESAGRLATLTARERDFRETYDADGPGAVDALDHADYDGVEDVWLDLNEWRTVRRRIDRLEAVRRQRRSDRDAPRP